MQQIDAMVIIIVAYHHIINGRIWQYSVTHRITQFIYLLHSGVLYTPKVRVTEAKRNTCMV